MARQPGREGASGHQQSRLWRRLTSERITPRGPLGGGKMLIFPILEGLSQFLFKFQRPVVALAGI